MTTASPHRPALSVEVAGRVLPDRIAATISLVLVRQALGAPTAVEIDFTDPDVEAVSTLRHGASVVLSVDQATAPLFSGDIVALEHDYDGAQGRMLRIRAYDPLHSARRRRRVRTLENTSAATLAREIAAAAGLAVSIRHDPPARSLVIQRGESDLALLRALAAEAGLYPIVRSNVLHLFTLAGDGEDVPLHLGRELHSVRIRRSTEAEVRVINIVGWDATTLESHRQSVRAAGAPIAESASAEESGRYALDRLVESSVEARAIGERILDRAAATAVTAAGSCTGDPTLVPGTRISLAGMTIDSGGHFVITEAVHRIDAAMGYITTFETAPPTQPVNTAQPIITCARVIATDDPKDLGRCRLRFETLDEVESGWLQMLVAGAGKGKGLTALPEIGDEVLVVLPDGDPARGFVLGGLYGQQRLPRGATLHKTRPFVLRTADGQTLELGGDPSIARLSTSNGSLVELTRERMRLAAATDLVIEAPGRTVTIRADAIKLEQG